MLVHRLVNVFTSVITNESSSLPRPSSKEDHGKSDGCVLGSSRGVRLPAQWVRFEVNSAFEIENGKLKGKFIQKLKQSLFLHLCVMIHNSSEGEKAVNY